MAAAAAADRRILRFSLSTVPLTTGRSSDSGDETLNRFFPRPISLFLRKKAKPRRKKQETSASTFILSFSQTNIKDEKQTLFLAYIKKLKIMWLTLTLDEALVVVDDAGEEFLHVIPDF